MDARAQEMDNKEGQGSIRIEGVGNIVLPEGMQIKDFPKDSLSVVALAMKNTYQSSVQQGRSKKDAGSITSIVAQTLIDQYTLENEIRQQFQVFVNIALNAVARNHDPSLLIIN